MKWIQYFLSWAGAGAIIVSSTEYIWSGLCSQEVIAPTLVCSMLLGAAKALHAVRSDRAYGVEFQSLLYALDRDLDAHAMA